MEKPVVRIELAEGARVEKHQGAFGATFGFGIVHVCEDGTRYPDVERHRLKRDAVAAFAGFPKTPNPGEYVVQVDDKTGVHTSTIWSPFASLRNAG